MGIFSKRKKKKENYENLVFVEVEKFLLNEEEDLYYLKFVLDGSDGLRKGLKYKIAGIRKFTDTSILITLANIDIDLLKEYLENYEGVRVV